MPQDQKGDKTTVEGRSKDDFLGYAVVPLADLAPDGGRAHALLGPCLFAFSDSDIDQCSASGPPIHLLSPPTACAFAH